MVLIHSATLSVTHVGLFACLHISSCEFLDRLRPWTTFMHINSWTAFVLRRLPCHMQKMQKKWGGGVAPLGQSIKSAAPGPACSKFGRRVANLLSPGGPRIPPGPSTFSKKVRSFFGSIFGLRFCQFWVPKCRQNPPKIVSNFFSTGVLFLHPILYHFSY